MPEIGPTVARRTIARLLREKREETGASVTAAAKKAAVNQSTLSRIETGVAKVEVGTAVLLFRKYGVPDEELEILEEIAHAARQKSPFPIRVKGNIPEWFRMYVGLEEDASGIKTYNPDLPPGFMQTEECARTLISTDIFPPSDIHEEDARVQVREARKKSVLDSKKPLSVILGETVLWRHIGDVATTVGQLEALQELSERDHVSIRIVPFTATHSANYGRFVVMGFPPPITQEVVYTGELPNGAQYIEEPAEVTTYHRMFARLEEVAHTEMTSQKMIAQAISRLG